MLAVGCSDAGEPVAAEGGAVWIETDEGVGYNVLDAIPDNLEAGIEARNGTVDLSSYIQAAIDQVCAAQLTGSEDAVVAFPAGTYLIEHSLQGCDALTLAGAKSRGRRGAALQAGPNFDSPVNPDCTPGHEYDRNCLRAPMLNLEKVDPNVTVTGLVFNLNEQDVDGIRIYSAWSHRIERNAFSGIKVGQAAVRGSATIDLTFRDNRVIGDGFSLDLRSLNGENGDYGVNVGLIEENYFQAGGGVRFGGIGINFVNNWLESSLDSASRAWVEACDNNAPGSSALHEYRAASLSNNYFEVSNSWEPTSPPDPLPSGSAIRACHGGTVTDNFIAGPGSTGNAYVGLNMPLAGSVITGNIIRDWSNCANVVGGNADTAGVFLANTMHACPTFTVGGEGNHGLIETPDGGYSLSGASTSVGVVPVSLTGNSIDAAAGSLQELVTSVAREVTQVDNKQPGQQLCLLSPNDLVTLDAGAFNRLSDYELVPGEMACFVVDDDLLLRAVNLPHETLAALGDLPNLDWWLENNVSQLQLSGTNVERWFAQVGGSTHDVLQTTVAKQPQWLNGALDMQGSRLLVGNGTAADWSFLHNAGTLFMVLRPAAGSTSGYFLGTAPDGGPGTTKKGFTLFMNTNSTVRVRVYNGTATYAATFATPGKLTRDATQVFALSLSASSGTAHAYRDYLELGSGPLGSLPTGAPNLPVRVGDKGDTAGVPFPGAIYEVIHYASELNERQRSAVVELLRAKHGL